MSINKVSIKFKPGAYGMFRNLQNKVWYALGEYVDNALQSYLSNKAELKKLDRKYQLKVHIDINWEKDTLRIHDNAAGINAKNFMRAFEPAHIPTDNTGLHEFGMGMKTASVWLADDWTVKSAALGESIVRTVHFNLAKVQKEEKEVLDVKSDKKKSKNDHFTELTLHKLSKNAPTPYQMPKVKSHLTSIYRKFLRTGEMQLIINGERMDYEDPVILDAPYYNDPQGKEMLWKREIDFQQGKYRAKGFIGLLKDLSTSEHNGLSLFRRGRVIEGSHDEKYRPKSLSGQVGSFRYKRVFGELELIGFNVSFNKGSFQEQEELDSLIEGIKKELTKGKYNFLKQADEYRKTKDAGDNAKIAKYIAATLRKGKDNDAKKIKDSIKQIETGSPESEKLIAKAKAIETYRDTVEVLGSEYSIEMEIINDAAVQSLYTLSMQDGDMFSKSAICKVNLNHPLFSRYEMFKSKEDYQPVIQLIRALVIAELIAPSQGTKNGGNIRVNFNKIIRNI